MMSITLMKFNVQLLAYEADDLGGRDDQRPKSLSGFDECPEHAQTGYGPKGDKLGNT